MYTGYEIYAGICEYRHSHSHLGHRDNCNVLLSLDGEVRLGIRGKRLEFGPGTLFMIEPGPQRRFQVPDHWQSYWMHFNMDAHIQIRPEWPAVGPGVYAVTPTGDDLNQLRLVFAEIIHICTVRRHGWYLLAYCMAQEVILRGNMACHAAALGEHIELTAKMLENLSSPRSIDEIAGKCAMSRSGFFSKFRSTFGTTPAKYREQQILNQVQSLLEHSDLSIKEIARELNIGSSCYLSTRFKKAFGLSPREYRRHHRDDAPGK